jgi:glycosyltransferase involved in cell wall biosynthesis
MGWGASTPDARLSPFLELGSVRTIGAAALLVRGAGFLAGGSLYRAMNDICRVFRVAGQGPLKDAAGSAVRWMTGRLRGGDGPNVLMQSYLASSASGACASLYSIAGSGPHDIFRDLIVLKRSSPEEKGVILLKYARTFDAVIALFDLQKLLSRYTFVLEPCWAGYCDPSILMYIQPGHPVFVQCFTEEDFAFVESIGAPLVPLRLGPADWVDTDLFSRAPLGTKVYDLVMVANWEAHKRHAELFRALSRIKGRALRVLLVGFPLGKRTIQDVRREASVIDNPLIDIEFREKLPPHELADAVGQCKVFVFLSKKEGDNKALVEAMFLNVPAIVYENTIGGARSRINSSTGILSSDEDLADRILYMIDHYNEFSPRAWALQHTGSTISTRRLNEAIRGRLNELGQRFTEGIEEKTNSPNLAYKVPACRERLKGDYEFILSCRRSLNESRGLGQEQTNGRSTHV